MRLVEVALENFRGYGARTVLPVDNLTVLIGKNDAGKSTFLEALNIVLGDGKIDATDIHVHASADSAVRIECAFDELPATLTLDSGSSTSLADEYLVDKDGRLRLRWTHKVSGDSTDRKLGKEVVELVAEHPTHPSVAELHSKKNADLKKAVTSAGVPGACDLNNNASMRQALWKKASQANQLALQTEVLELAKEDGKSILGQLHDALPLYFLFRADRPSTDQDAEVQDPMKSAVQTALKELGSEVEAMKQKVREKAVEVATRTLANLREFDDALAASLTPAFAEPKLESAFKLSLVGDDGIAVNKRGSGVRRLVLFSFFRAEAERRLEKSDGRGIIYAVEEPETAQHPDFQRKVVETLNRLSSRDGCQVLLTTHTPGLAGLLPAIAIRWITTDGARRVVEVGEPALHAAVATLGVSPDHRVRVLVCVEGPYDRAFLQSACAAQRAAGKDLVCLTTDPRVAFVLLGGSTLTEWVNEHLLKHIGIPEYHIYDSDVVKYRAAVITVNQRGAGNSARQTAKRELENYLNPAAIDRVLAPVVGHAVSVTLGPNDDVEAVVAAAIPDQKGNPRKKLDRRAIKHWLNHDVAAAMTGADFDAGDPDGEILGWIQDISAVARGATHHPSTAVQP
jgi:putative ATP-dependent endonuclease of OLD family